MSPLWIRYLPPFLRSKIEGRAYLQNVVSNTGWQFGDHVLRMVIGLVVGIWVARYLGPEQFGLLSYCMAFVSLFAALAALGLDDIIVRDIVRDPSHRNTVLGTAFLLKLSGGLISFGAATASVFFLRPDDTLSHWLVAIIALGSIFQAFNVIEFWFHSQVQAKYAVFPKNIAFLLCSSAKIYFILSTAPLIAFAWIALAEVIIGAGGLVLAYRSKVGHVREWKGSSDRALRLFKDSWPLMLSGVVIAIYLRVDQVMLGQMVGNDEVGIYSVAVRLAEVWLFIPTAIYWSVFPSIVEAKAQSDELFHERLQKLYNFMALSSFGIAFPVMLIAQWLVPALFGAAYAEAGPLLAVLIWANLFVSLEIARSSFLTVMNWTRLYLVTVSLGCVLNIALNYYLIPIYGGMGAVIASLAAYWFAAHGSCFLFRPLFQTGIMLTRAIFIRKCGKLGLLR